MSTSSCTGAFPRVFFFQAEDGIRDLYVTGVQTCALPICRGRCFARGQRGNDQERDQAHRGIRQESGGEGGIRTHGELPPTAVFKTAALNHRSEERRVGKECSERGGTCHEKTTRGWSAVGR